MKRSLPILGWTASGIVVLLAFIAWGEGFNWQFGKLSVYKFFPFLGLIAFSLMWVHYIVAVVRVHLKLPKEVTKKYFETSGFIILFAFVLHPSLLIWQLWRDGYGLPPNSYLENYVAPRSHWAVLLGTISIFIFLAYELRRRFGERSWWQIVQLASDAAMIAIFFHALRLGKNLQQGWYRYVWIFYGVSLLLSLIYLYAAKWRSRNPRKDSI